MEKVAFSAIVVVCLLQAGVSAMSRLHERELSTSLSHMLSTASDVPIIDPPRRIAGYFDLNRTYDAKMFYFFFESRKQRKDDPVVLWMTGGPGCSSELAVFFENGPYSINKDLTLSESEYGWDVEHNMIFVDQPINTGFSYSDDERDRVHDEKGIADDILDFLQEFFDAHPEFAAHDFFVTGESYAGHYVPAVAHRVWLAKKLGEGKPINIQGLAIGNGMTDPAIQYGAYADFAVENKLIGKGLRDRIDMIYPVCRYGAQLCAGHDWKLECTLALQFCQITMFEPILAAAPGVNYYDIRKKCEGSLCYEEFGVLSKFLAQAEVRKALGVGSTRWEACSPSVYMDMMGDWMKQYDTLLPDMLADGMRVMIYAGDKDLICNWVGNRRWVDALRWKRAQEWSDADDVEWVVGGSPAGLVREVEGLAFVKVYDAGHMVPMDKPKHGLDMITRFTRGQPFSAPTGQQNKQLQRSHRSWRTYASWLRTGTHELTSEV